MTYPDWLDRREYPFDPHVADLATGRLHYLDEGAGPAVVMVHGTPEWSFVYRKLVKGLRGTYRCIVPDLPGFGLSDKPADHAYAPEQQAKVLLGFLESLNLDELTLVVHDFGGPVGLSYAERYPEKIRRLVLMNTWLWSVKGDPYYALFSRLMATPLGRWLYLSFNLSPRVLLKQTFGDKSKLTPELHRHYLEPFATPESRRALLAYAQSFITSDAWFERLWQNRESLRAIPSLILWGMKDSAFREKELRRLETLFDNLQTVRLEGVGHSVPEEAGETVLPLIEAFLQDRAVL